LICINLQNPWGAVASLGPQAARDLANYFAIIPPRPANDGNWGLVATGRAIYIEGIPEANNAPCYACYGPNAEGGRDVPWLGGLAYFYLKARLQQWGQGYRLAALCNRSVAAVEIVAPRCIDLQADRIIRVVGLSHCWVADVLEVLSGFQPVS